MLKEKQLNEDITNFKCSSPCTRMEAKGKIERLCKENNVPVGVEFDTLKVGGLLSSKEIECLVLSHPEHERDYYKIVVVLGFPQVTMASIGVSKQMKKHAIAEIGKQQRAGKSLSWKLGHLATSSLFLIGKSKNKLEIEQEYYNALFQIVGAALELQ